jgi:hypothetical protein
MKRQVFLIKDYASRQIAEMDRDMLRAYGVQAQLVSDKGFGEAMLSGGLLPLLGPGGARLIAETEEAADQAKEILGATPE